MYRHLLVPVDDTEASVDLVASAVHLAAGWRARVTFLHTLEHQENRTPTGHLHTSTEGQLEPTSVVLAKAEAAAGAWGVPCCSIQADSQHHAGELATTALSQRCDLVLLTSPEFRDQEDDSIDGDPIRAVQRTGLPVLILASTPESPSTGVIRVLREEHRLLATVLNSWGQMLASETTASTDSMHSMLERVERSQARHMNKEQKLFLRLRARTSMVNPDLDELSHQHQREIALLARLADLVQTHSMSQIQSVQREARNSLVVGIAEYTQLVCNHLGREEAVVFPEARRHLLDIDWTDLKDAFAHSDSKEADLRTLQTLNDTPARLSERPHAPAHEARTAA